MDETEFVMPPRDAARSLKVAPSTLRRLAPTYEAVHGPLPWEGEESGGSRMWPQTAVERVRDARALVASGRAKSLDSALRALAEGAQVPREGLAPPDNDATMAFRREELENYIDEKIERAVSKALARHTPPALPEVEVDRRPGWGEQFGRRLDELFRRLRG